ncbi:hypothetical protein VF21_09954 [Pseudogymnoascus sp. 05NY08]|nr:hypothetical protein VF21_09954 [Pseudogymnoascus sp. 05NY08]
MAGCQRCNQKDADEIAYERQSRMIKHYWNCYFFSLAIFVSIIVAAYIVSYVTNDMYQQYVFERGCPPCESAMRQAPATLQAPAALQAIEDATTKLLEARAISGQAGESGPQAKLEAYGKEGDN